MGFATSVLAGSGSARHGLPPQAKNPSYAPARWSKLKEIVSLTTSAIFATWYGRRAECLRSGQNQFYQKRQCNRMQQLPYHCFDEPYWEADDDNLDKKTTGPSRRTLSRRTGWLSERQEYDPANICTETDSREGKKERSNNAQLLRQYYSFIEGEHGQLISWKCTGSSQKMDWDKETWFRHKCVSHTLKEWRMQRPEGWHCSPRSQHQQSEICRWHRPNRGKQQQLTGSSTTLQWARKVIGPSHKQSRHSYLETITLISQ